MYSTSGDGQLGIKPIQTATLVQPFRGAEPYMVLFLSAEHVFVIALVMSRLWESENYFTL
jgi:hypothetical protein